METKAVFRMQERNLGSQTLLCKRALSHVVEAAEKVNTYRKAFRLGKWVSIFVFQVLSAAKQILGATLESIYRLFRCVSQMPAIIWIVLVKPKMFTLEWLWNWVSACSSSFTDAFNPQKRAWH
jgi:hypothetical protein